MEKDNIVHVDDAESTESSMGLPMAKIETSGGDGGRLEQIATMEVENYHGFTWKIVLVLLSDYMIGAASFFTIVGSGAFVRTIDAATGSAGLTAWPASIIVIAQVTLPPMASQAMDLWGRKWFLVGGTSLACIGDIIISRATTPAMEVAGFVVASIGQALALPASYAVPSEIIPRKWRPEALAGFNISTVAGALFTLLVGTVIVDDSVSGWRTFFYIAAGVNALAAITMALTYFPILRPLQTALTLREKLARLDWIGALLLLVGLVLFIVGLSWSQNPYEWTNAHILATFIIGCVFTIAFALYEWKGTSNGILAHELFARDRNFALASGIMFVEGGVFYSINLFLSFEMVVLYDTAHPYLASVRFSAFFISAALASGLSAWTMSSFRQLRTPALLGFVCFIIYYICAATATLYSSKAFWAYIVILGLGNGPILVGIISAAQLSAPPHLIATSSAIATAVRGLGGAIALAIYNAVFNSQVSVKLPGDIAAAVLPLGFSPSNLGPLIEALVAGNEVALAEVPGATPEIIRAAVKGLQQGYLESFRYVWVTAGCLCLVALIATFFIIDPKKDMNMHVDAPLDTEEGTHYYKEQP